MLGFGAHRYLKDDLALRLEIDRFQNVRSGDMNFVSVGVISWFRNL